MSPLPSWKAASSAEKMGGTGGWVWHGYWGANLGNFLLLRPGLLRVGDFLLANSANPLKSRGPLSQIQTPWLYVLKQ